MSENDEHDQELKAISVTLAALKDLNSEERDRVLSYVLKRLDMAMPVEIQQATPAQLLPPPTQPIVPSGTYIELKRQHDIRSFKEEKNPKSANEMAAVVAYFLQYEAGESERQDTITKSDVEKYFHVAKFTKPKDAKNTLQNSKNAGYLEARDRGAFALSPVGYNLVAHSLPRKTT